MVNATMASADHLANAESLRLFCIASIKVYLVKIQALKIGKNTWPDAFYKT
jgi:hypothetical protein